MYIRYRIKFLELIFPGYVVSIRFSIGNEINLIVLTLLILKLIYS